VEEVGKVCGKVKMLQYGIYTYVNGKMILVETIPGLAAVGE
jgi:hypothetical protein